ncbi:MAG: DUF192 domain-containing protein [Rickettsiales bacterium]|nr:DUF192 domain-containing protein [Rickettsiales bacterium]
MILSPSVSAKENRQFNSNPKNYNVKLQILNQQKQQIAEFATAIADTNEKKRTGLMFLESMPSNQAMLFLFEESEIISMWMKNTKIPLDMLFIDKNNIIVDIVDNTSPYSLKIISSRKPVNKVLEINAELSKSLKIKIGDKVEFKL